MMKRDAFQQDPKLFVPVKVRVLKPFYIGGGKVPKIGETVTLPLHDAKSMAALGKVEIIQAA